MLLTMRNIINELEATKLNPLKLYINIYSIISNGNKSSSLYSIFKYIFTCIKTNDDMIITIKFNIVLQITFDVY